MKVVQNLLSILNLRAVHRPSHARQFCGALLGLGFAVACLSATAAPRPLGAPGSTYTWNQTGTDSWTVAGNWTPARNTPATDDILIFNNGATTTATNVPAQTIGKLQVSGNTLGTLQSGAANNTLTISGGPTALSVAAGSQLNVSSSVVLLINLPTGSSGSISGSIDFAGAAHKLTAVDASGITFQNGSSFIADTGFSSNPFGSANLNSVVFASGSTYVFKSGSNPFAATAPSSVVVFQTGSLFSTQGTGLPAFSGRTYADFELNATNYNNTSTGGGLLSMDNLTVKAGVIHLNLTGNVIVKGNISVLFTNILDFSPATPATNGLALNGSSVQTISGAGTLTFGANEIVTINNTAGVTLQRDIAISNVLTNNGTLNCGVNNITGTGTITVNSGGKLTGSGTISPALILNGTLSPGASPGTINTANETWNGGGSYVWEINDVDAGEGVDPGWDLINVTGGLTINATSGNKFNIDITSLTLADAAGDVHDFDNTATYTWRILKTTTGITGFDASAFNLNTANFSNPLGTGHFTLEIANGNKDLQLRFVHPSTITITCPQNVAVACASAVPPAATDAAGFTAQGGTITDDCGGAVTVSSTDAISSSNCPNQYIITRTYAVTNACGTGKTCDQMITVNDTTPPTINCGTNETVSCGQGWGFTVPIVSDNCGGSVSVVAESTVTNVGCGNTFVATRIWRATDTCGNSTTCTQMVTVVDTTAPMITCPADTTAQCGQTGTNFTGTATATDNCGIVSITFSDVTNPGTCPTNSIITRTWKATDACTNMATCDQTIWVVNNAGPVFTNCPAGGNLGCNPATIPDCDPSVGAHAECGLTLTCSKLDATNGCVRTRTITYTAVDGCNNTNTCTQVVTWTEDTTPPVFNPQPFAVCGATNFLSCNVDELSIPHCLASVGATDDCGTAIVACTSVQTTNLCPGSATDGTRTRVITYTARDACNNTNICRAVFIWTVDKTKPVLSGCPSPTLNLGCNPATVPTNDTYNVTASDACSAVTLTKTQVDTTNGCNRTRTLTYTATDCGNNSSSCSQTITWKEDTTAPALVNCPAPTLNLGCNPENIPSCTNYNVTATDDCGTTPTVACTTSATVTNGCGRSRTITYTATDACNNSASCSQVVSWTEDTTAPVFTNCLPATVNLGCNPASVPDCGSPVIGATDDCGTVTLTCSKLDTVNGCVHTRRLVNTATDACGNHTTCVSTITWSVDNGGPVLHNCPAPTLNLGCNPATIPVCTTYNVTATDDCSSPIVSCNQATVTNGCLRTRTLTYTAVDTCSHTSTCSQVITWTVDTTAPVFTNCPAPTLNLGCNPSSIPDCDAAVGATDNCGVTNISCSRVDATNGCARTRTLIYTAVDGCNNTNTCAQVITWSEHTSAPVLVNCPAPTLALGCNPSSVPTCTNYNVTATDNCGVAVSCAQVTATNGCLRTRTLTYTATDGCGNSNTCSQVLTWTVDTVAPVFTNCPANINLGCNPASVPGCDPTVGATDNCGVTNITCASVDATNGCVVTRTLTYTAVDGCNNAGVCTQVITWTEDTTPPGITCPPDAVADCGKTAPVFTGVATATDNCVGPIAITYSDVSSPDACPTNRVITRTWKAVDGCNNMATCNQIITVINTNGPAFTNCPANTNIGCNPVVIPDCSSPVSASADCAVSITCDKLDATNGCVRTRTITWTAVDACNQTNTCTQVVTWTQDTTPPVFNPQPFTCDTTNNLGCNPNELTIPHCLASIGATDNCSTPTVTCSSIQTTNLCAGSATDGVRTRIVTYRAVDACGNTNLCRAVFIWTVDNTKPVLSGCPASTLNLGCNPGTIPTTNTYSVTATDVCSTVTLSKTQVDATNGCNRTRTITYTATDCGNNSSSCSQVVSWKEDTTPPALVNCPAPTLDLGTNPVSVPTCGTYNVAATDGCGTANVTCSSVDTTNGCSRTRTLTYTAVDVCNNTNTCAQVISWTLAPTVSLSIAIQGNNVVISWPVSCVNFTLQQTSDLTNPSSWTTVSTPPVQNGNQLSVTVPITSNTFYRLIYP